MKGNTKVVKAENEKAFKHLFGPEHLERLGKSLHKAYPDFDRKAFRSLYKELSPLEMKPRVRLIAAHLHEQLPQNYLRALKILSSLNQGLQAFDYWPLTHFVQSYGLEHPLPSLKALQIFTVPFTSEWAIRPFLIQDQDTTLRFLLKAATHSDHRIRRWASEGTRPRLPWGERLRSFIEDPRPTFPILEQLKYDEELFVRKSVANHLNDIAKDHPKLVLDLLRSWQAEAPEEHQAKIRWITRHALRSLIKAGHAETLLLLGAKPAELEISHFKLKKKQIVLGEALEFSFELSSKAKTSQNLIVDYVVSFVKANGKTAPKVFKLKNLQLDAKEHIILRKTHAIKPITTRAYYAGQQELAIQVNGKIIARLPWTLKIP